MLMIIINLLAHTTVDDISWYDFAKDVCRVILTVYPVLIFINSWFVFMKMEVPSMYLYL